ncbi:MAG: MCE family protein [Xanthobacteraceae bacterium]|nr:MAG: MCE family protein [Xanthobacteraceae bacterium]
METRANFVLIGFFTLAAILGAFGFIYWFQHVGSISDRVQYRAEFAGPVSGLRTGAAVTFNGIRVGEVSSIGLSDPQRVVAILSVERSTPVRQDTQLGLEFQGLTGIASVSLHGGALDSPPIEAKPGELPVIRAAEGFSDITETARATLQRVDRVIAENQEQLRNTMRSIEAFTAMLARNSGRMDSILAGVEQLANKDGKGDLQEATRSIKRLADNLDKRSGGLISEGRRTIGDIDRAVRNFDRNPTRLLFGGPSVFDTPAQQQPQTQQSQQPQGQQPQSQPQRQAPRARKPRLQQAR